MAAQHDEPGERVPIGQRFFDNIPLLFALGILITGVVYVAWGIWEIMVLPTSPLR